MKEPLPPFSCTYSPNVPELLNGLNISLALSTYQAGKVIFLSALNNEKLIQLPRNFEKAMGVAVNGKKMAIASNDELTVLSNASELAQAYPPKPNTYDSLYLPRVTYHTGQLALHDTAWTKQGLVSVNTNFSCLSAFDDNFSFNPIWQPHFISELHPEDRCHLNGMAVENGRVKYVSALGKSDTPGGWREGKMNGGILMDVAKNEIVIDGLPMPHSPRIYDGKLYALLSAVGELVEIDLVKGEYQTLVNIGSFARGMAKFGEYLFIGTSKLRHNTSSFKDLPIAGTSIAGISIVYLPYKSIVGKIEYQTSAEEIYDVQVLPGIKRPNIISAKQDMHKQGIVSPQNNYWAQPEKEHETITNHS